MSFCCPKLGQALFIQLQSRFADTDDTREGAEMRNAYHEEESTLKRFKAALGVLHALTSSLEHEITVLQPRVVTRLPRYEFENLPNGVLQILFERLIGLNPLERHKLLLGFEAALAMPNLVNMTVVNLIPHPSVGVDLETCTVDWSSHGRARQTRSVSSLVEFLAACPQLRHLEISISYCQRTSCRRL